MSRSDDKPSRITDDLVEHEPVVVGQHSAVIIHDRGPERDGLTDVVGVTYIECGCGWQSFGGRFRTIEDARAAIEEHVADTRRLIELEAWLAARPGGGADKPLTRGPIDAHPEKP